MSAAFTLWPLLAGVVESVEEDLTELLGNSFASGANGAATILVTTAAEENTLKFFYSYCSPDSFIDLV